MSDEKIKVRVTESGQTIEVVALNKRADRIEIVIGEGVHSVRCELTPTRNALAYVGNAMGREIVYERTRADLKADIDRVNPTLRKSTRVLGLPQCAEKRHLTRLQGSLQGKSGPCWQKFRANGKKKGEGAIGDCALSGPLCTYLPLSRPCCHGPSQFAAGPARASSLSRVAACKVSSDL
jgi:hypothetical protein